MPGFGRGAPGTAGAGRPIPVLLVNGLLPGRGAAGRPIPVLPPKGLLPGRGPAGRGVVGLAPASGSAAGATAAAGATGAAGLGVSTGTTGAGSATDTAAGAASATTGASSVAAAAFFLAAGFAADAASSAAGFAAGAASSAAGAGGIASRSLRTTGASTVDDADLTNSPSSCSLARTSLLVTPSSFASSWTRTFDTTLLSWSGRDAPDRQCERCIFMLVRSWGVHPRITPDPRAPMKHRTSKSPNGRPETVVPGPPRPEARRGPLDRPRAGLGRMPFGAQRGQGIPGRGARAHHAPASVDAHPEQAFHRRRRPEGGQARRRADGIPRRCAGGRVHRLPRSVPLVAPCSDRRTRAGQSAAGGSSAGWDTGTGAVSGRISMRHPVSRAASRAFWPSRPMANDSW
jgi:hypothetical protein